MTKENLTTKNENTWCPGCPNFLILEAVKKALVNLMSKGLKQEDIAMVTGIGCHAKIYDYIKNSRVALQILLLTLLVFLVLWGMEGFTTFKAAYCYLANHGLLCGIFKSAPSPCFFPELIYRFHYPDLNSLLILFFL